MSGRRPNPAVWVSKVNVVMGSFGNKLLLLLSPGRIEEDLTNFSLE